jgi:hypothetical protein
MERSKLADYSEIISSMAIVVTLIFLSVEIRQNTNALYAESSQSVLSAAQSELFELMENPDIVLNMIKPDPLTAEDQVKIGAFLAATIRTREFSWLQFQSGIIGEAQWGTETAVIRSLLDSPRARDWWENNGRNNFDAGFVAFVDRENQNHPATGDSWRADSIWASH